MNDRPSADPADFLASGGEMAKLIRAMDWSRTPLGPIERWPQNLRTTVSLCLASTFPICIAWGPGHVQIYNDGYWPICGGKHPVSMGQDFTQCWASAWPVIGEAFARGQAGEASYLENQLMFLDRRGYLEETFFTFSFSPIRDETGQVGGLFHPVIEQTAKMLSERRTRVLGDLTARTGNARTVADVLRFAADTLADNAVDVPFALFYRLEADGAVATLAASAGLPPGTAASPERLDLATAPGGWPLAEALRPGPAIEIADLAGRFGALTCGPYPEPPHTAFVLPIAPPGSAAGIAVMVVGVSPRLPLDGIYRGFYDLIAATVTAAVVNARASEQERLRAEVLAQLDRAKTNFFSNVSHEFRTPLTLMLGPLEDLLGDPVARLDAVQRDRLDLAHRNALRLLKLVNTLLDFARIQAGRMQAAFAPTDLAALTADLASNFRSACEQAGLTLAIDCDPLPAPVHVDRDMWEKIVLNLLSNAFKFTLTGGITVTLRADDAGGVELAVRDTGIGIAAAELPRLFERFHRVVGAQGRSHEGSGIGLALVQDLVTLHGGRIGVESTVGQGSVFRLTIPFGTAHLPPDAIHPAQPAAAHSAGADAFVEEALRWLPEAPGEAGRATGLPDTAALPIFGAGHAAPRALLADDNADMRAYVTRILQAGGYVVEAVADGEAALAALRAGAVPDVVISDVMMPKLDGFGLLRALRQDPEMEGVLVILLSARAGEEARVEGLAAGADDYVIKPFSARELRARVDGAVSLSRTRRDAAAREAALRTALAAERGTAALLDSQSRLALALESARLGAWELDSTTDTAVLSARHMEIFGYDHAVAQWGFRTSVEHIVPDDRAWVERTVGAAIEAGERYHLECRIRRADTGAIRWIEVHGAPLPKAIGPPTQFIGIVQDVTERHQKAESQALLAAIVDASDDAIIGKSLDGIITSWNSGAERMFGWTAAEAIGQSIMLIIPPDRRAEETEFLAKVRAGARVRHFDTVRRHRDGTAIPASVTISPISDARGHLIGASKVLRDVSEQRRSEQALRQANETLEQRVAERTRELALQLEGRRQAEAALAQAQKMEAVGQLTGGIAHDFNNLLTVISGNLHFVIEMAQSNERMQRLASSMQRAVDRGARLTGQLLAFARRQALLPEVLRLDQSIREFSTLIQRALGETVQLQIDADRNVWSCEIDASQFESAVLNLAINARDAMPEGGRLTIAIRNVTHDGSEDLPAGDYVAVSVTDTGHGMTPEVLEHAVEPFFTTKDVGRGSGLGLSQAYGFLQQSGGALRIESRAGEGTTVIMLFPHSVAQIAVSDADKDISVVPPHRPAQVLVVEDDAGLLDLFTETLTAAGHEVFGAHDGREALALLGAHPDMRLMLSDVVMPNGISGVELGREAQRRWPALRVVLMSGYPREELSRFGSTGAFPFLAKPFRPSELIDRLEALLHSNRP